MVPPGEGWTHDPYGGEIEDGKLYGRAAAVSKSDFATFTFAVRALESLQRAAQGRRRAALHLRRGIRRRAGPGWLLKHQLTQPDLLIAAGFSYQVVTAHNGCLQLEVTVHGKMAHAAIPDTGVDALQGAVQDPERAVRAERAVQRHARRCRASRHPYLNVGRIEGGTNTNVVPGKVVFKLDRRMIPEENPAEVEADVREVIAEARRTFAGHHGGDPAHAAGPVAASRCPATPLVEAIQKHGERCSARRSRRWARRSTPTCACTARPAFPA